MARLPVAPPRTPDLADATLAVLADSNPAAAQQARESLDIAIADLRGSAWPAVAWDFSRLTASGCPLEISFSTADPSLRYTVEVAGAETAPQERVQRCTALIAELSDGQIPAGVLKDIADLQHTGTLGWGAWLGGRHDGRHSRYKLYAEVPVESCPWAIIDTGDHGLLRYRHPRLEGVGHEIQTGLTERYYRLDGLDIADTGVLLNAVGLGAGQHDLLDLMTTVYRRPVRPHLPRHPFGVSVASTADDGVVAVSVFAYAIDIFGDDAATRSALLDTAPKLGWDDAAYRALSAPLADTHTAPTHHSVIAFTIPRSGPAALTVGLAPPR
jgi:hypothetical protein